MFSPAAKKQSISSRKDRNLGQTGAASPATPFRTADSFPSRPSTGTPAPWAPRLSVLARISPSKNKNDKEDEVDPTKPVYVEEFPQVLRDEQAKLMHKRHPGDAFTCGGIDRETSLLWVICGHRLFIWSYLSAAAARKCTVLDLPSDVMLSVDTDKSFSSSTRWLLCSVNWEDVNLRNDQAALQYKSIGIILCDKKSQAVMYWPNIYSGEQMRPILSFSTSSESGQHSNTAAVTVASNTFSSLITSPEPCSQFNCIALACSSSGDLWRFRCSPTGIQREKVHVDIFNTDRASTDSGGTKGYVRSLIWRFPSLCVGQSSRQFFLLTNTEIQCFSVLLSSDMNVSKLWSHEIVGASGDLGIQKDLAGQKRIWPLDVQVGGNGKELVTLVATFCKDRFSSSSYIQYSLLTMQYKSGVDVSSGLSVSPLEKKSPIQEIVPKARVEDEDFLFSMRLRVGGKPSGSCMILSGDGTATVANYYRGSTRLYQFDLPHDAGRVLDASTFPPTEDSDDGAWVILTEKAGVWAIPEKAVLLGGVEPPERSLSRKGSLNEGSVQEERRNLTFVGEVAPRRVSSETWDSGDKKRPALTGFSRRIHPDEESEALKSGAFDREGETNAFARTSKSIVDTLAKHWTTTRGAEIVALTVVSNQLLEKQQKHQRFLQFLALSKCHEELSMKQRHALQIIMEHGEKLAGMIQLRELQNVISQKRSNAVSAEREISGSLWDLIQLVGEKERRNTVLLMDRDNAEVFYSKVSDLEEIFSCLERHLEVLVCHRHPLTLQIQRVCELCDAAITLVVTASGYRSEHHMWYPDLQGLNLWYCQSVVRNGMWRIACAMLQMLEDKKGLDSSLTSELYSHLEKLAEVLLEAYAGAVAAKAERKEDYRGLLDEFCTKRDKLLVILYEQLKIFAASASGFHQESNQVSDDAKYELLRKLSSGLLSIAKRHEGYLTLWNICYDLNDPELLRNLMQESMGPKGGFSYFVFNQLYEKKKFAELLRLGEEFQEELSIFLKDHHDLLWLHQLFLHQFALASETLHSVAVSLDDNVVAAGEGKPTLAERKRLLNLSKIASIAGNDSDADYGMTVRRIEADLKLLKLQDEITKLTGGHEQMQINAEHLLRPEDLINLCLENQSPETILLAFDVFAWTGSSFRKNNKALLEECWRAAADLDDWEKLF
uniref:Nucleoporin Nup133/Nup155-like N-terminal domain-containing protein n=1 Tax=Kalanchoe fedtschenkoi TaxID=63787 RepID=A0A7N0ZWG3_KALFE